MVVTTVALRSSHAPGLAPDLELAATLYLPDQASASSPAPGLVVGHGAGSRRTRHDEFCREACTQGFAVLALDFRGHGESDGAVDGPLELDVLAAAAFLRAHPAVDGRAICYRGSSMGGFYGLKAAATAAPRGFAALVLLCPAGEQVLLDGLDSIGEGSADTEARTSEDRSGATRWDVPALRVYLQSQDSIRLAAAVTCPVLLVHAREDEVVPFEHSLALTRALAGDVTLMAVAGGSHTTAQHDPSVHHSTGRWLREQLLSR